MRAIICKEWLLSKMGVEIDIKKLEFPTTYIVVEVDRVEYYNKFTFSPSKVTKYNLVFRIVFFNTQDEELYIQRLFSNGNKFTLFQATVHDFTKGVN